jgi:hypothetical protein
MRGRAGEACTALDRIDPGWPNHHNQPAAMLKEAGLAGAR